MPLPVNVIKKSRQKSSRVQKLHTTFYISYRAQRLWKTRMMCGWTTSILGKVCLEKLVRVVVCFYLFLCFLVSFDSQPKCDWARQVWARFWFLLIVSGFIWSRFILFFSLDFFSPFVNSIWMLSSGSRQHNQWYSRSLLACSRLHSWHKIRMLWLINLCRDSGFDQVTNRILINMKPHFLGPKKPLLLMWPPLLKIILFSKCPLDKKLIIIKHVLLLYLKYLPKLSNFIDVIYTASLPCAIFSLLTNSLNYTCTIL